MANITVSSAIDIMMQAADAAGIRSAIGLAAVGNGEAIGWADAQITRNAAGRVGMPAITLTQGTITADAPILNASATWNNAGVTFTGIRSNITDTASNAASLLMDLQVGGSSRFRVTKAGWINTNVNGGVDFNNGNGAAAGVGSYRILRSGADPDMMYYAELRHQFFGAFNGLNWTFDQFGVQVRSDFGYNFSSTTSAAGVRDLCIMRDAAGILAQRNGTNAQTFRLYGTFTDASNFERGFMRWASNVLEIGTEAAGTGTQRRLDLVTGTSPVRIRNGRLEFDDGNGFITRTSGGNTMLFSASGNTPQMTLSGPGGLVMYTPLITTADNTSLTVRAINRGGNTGDGLPVAIIGGNGSSAAGGTVGGAVSMAGGDAIAGNNNGGNVTIRGGLGFGTGANGRIIMDRLPTSAAGLPTGAIWNDAGTLKIA
jgi:hypothetical protein